MKGPSAPDPYAQASAQMGANVDTALANQMMGWGTQTTPWGTQTTSQGAPREITMSDGTTRTIYGTNTSTTLNPQLQATLDATMGAQTSLADAARGQAGRVSRTLATPFQYSADTPALASTLGRVNLRDSAGLDTSIGSRAGQVQTSYAGADDFSADRDQYTRALMARAAPDQARARESADANLIGRGIGIGSQAYGATMDQLGRDENDARLAAILAGGQEQARMVGMARDAAGFNNAAVGQQFQQELAAGNFGNAALQQEFGNYNNAELARRQAELEAGNFGNQARSQSIQEQTALRNQPLNELSALQSQTQVQSPQFNSWQQGNMSAPQIAQYMQDAYANKVGANSAKWQGIGSILGSVAGLGMMRF